MEVQKVTKYFVFLKHVPAITFISALRCEDAGSIRAGAYWLQLDLPVDLLV